MTDDQPFEQEMLNFARTLRKKAEIYNTPLEESTNAFKALTAFYAILRKYKSTDDGSEDTTFDDIQNEVRDVVERENANGRAPSPIRDR